MIENEGRDIIMLMKMKVYTKEIGVITLLSFVILITFISLNLTLITTVNDTKDTKLIAPKSIAKASTDTNVRFTAGITELFDSIEPVPIYQETNEELTNEIDFTAFDFELTGYIDVNTELNVRAYPNTSSEIITTLNWMDEIHYSIYDEEWACVQIDDIYGFVSSKYITGEYESYTRTYSVSGDKSKTFMDYRTITDRSSNQYKLQLRAYTNDDNGLRMLRGRYMVAIGSYFDCRVGQFIDVVLSDGEILECIVGDAKQDIHTDSQNLHGLYGDTVEFIVDSNVLTDTTDVIGNISDVSEEFDGKVVEVRVYDHIEK